MSVEEVSHLGWAQVMECFVCHQKDFVLIKVICKCEYDIANGTYVSIFKVLWQFNNVLGSRKLFKNRKILSLTGWDSLRTRCDVKMQQTEPTVGQREDS